MKRYVMPLLAVVLVVAVTGCASRRASTPAASVPETEGLAGVWQGAVSGPTVATSAGPQNIKATLTVNPDDTFALVEQEQSKETRSTGNIHVAGNKLTLDGKITAPSSRAGEHVTYTLERRGNGLYGNAAAFFADVPRTANIELKKVQ